MTTALNSILITIQTRRGDKTTHSISFDFTALEDLTPEQMRVYQSEIGKVIVRCVSLLPVFPYLEPSKH